MAGRNEERGARGGDKKSERGLMVTHCIQRFGEDVVQAVVGATIRVHHSAARGAATVGVFLFI